MQRKPCIRQCLRFYKTAQKSKTITASELQRTTFDTALDTQYALFSPGIVDLGQVSPILPVPQHIERPAYAKKIGTQAPYHLLVEQKSDEQIDRLRQACQLARQVVHFAGTLVKQGVTTDAIDRQVFDYIISHNAYPSTLHYNGYPKSICTSINEVFVHGIPDDRPLQNGDVINIDVTVFYKGMHGDTSDTFIVGAPKNDAFVHMIETNRLMVHEACKQAVGPELFLKNIGNTLEQVMQKQVQNYNKQVQKQQIQYQIARHLCGHGIGSFFHGLPQILHYANQAGIRETGILKLKPGMTFTIEPVLCSGTDCFVEANDNWTMFAADRKCSTTYEHTVLVTATGAEILTFDKKNDAFEPIIENMSGLKRLI